MAKRTEELISGVKGKLGELKGLGSLLRFGYSVYVPVVDTGIDCLVDVGRGNYKEIQIKYREDHGVFRVKEFRPRENFYIMCYLRTRYGETYWVIPSRKFSRMAKKSKGYYSLQIGKEGSKTYETLRKYRENLSQLLTGATKEARFAVSKLRIEEPHVKQQELERIICGTMFTAGAPMPPKRIAEFTSYGPLNFSESEFDHVIANLKRHGMIRNLRDKYPDLSEDLLMVTDKGQRIAK